MRKASKLSEVARLAGVSPITASRAIRGTGYVSTDARERIMAAAAQLNYTPDMLARRMRGDKSKLIGVFLNNYGPVVLHELVRHIGEQARKLDYDLLLFNADRFDSPERMITCGTLAKLCDGLLLVMPTAGDGFLELAERQQLSCALVCFDAEQLALPTLVLENRAGARAAVEHLLGLGHRRIGFIAGSSRTGQSLEREHGYADALAAAGIAVDPALVLEGGFNQPGGFAAAGRLLDLAQPPSAIFAANDEMAFGAIDAIASRRLQVPGDVSVVGFDDIPTASYVFPRLTSMRPPYEALAARAVREVVDMIEGRPPAAMRIPFSTELVVRDSTGPVSGSASSGG
jgi:LacI family transcriptional regulator